MDKIKNTWGGKRANSGGKREGAGRKLMFGEKLDVQVYCRVSKREQAKLKEKAKSLKMSLSQYIRSIVLKNIE